MITVDGYKDETEIERRGKQVQRDDERDTLASVLIADQTCLLSWPGRERHSQKGPGRERGRRPVAALCAFSEGAIKGTSKA